MTATKVLLALLGIMVLLVVGTAAAVAAFVPSFQVGGPGATPTPHDQDWPKGVQVGQPFILKVGDLVEVRPASFVLIFRGVPQDSRCPSNVTCPWAGEATVVMEVFGPQGLHEVQELTIGPEGKASIVVAGHQVTVSELLPYPIDGQEIKPNEYQVTVLVEAQG